MKNSNRRSNSPVTSELTNAAWSLIKSWLKQLRADTRGTALVEAAFALPLMIVLIMGGISYGSWFMSAHSVQQAANEAARAVVGSIDDEDRTAIVADVVADGILSSGVVQSDAIRVETEMVGNLFTVRISYDISESLLLSTSLIPMPEGPIVRSASVRLSSI